MNYDFASGMDRRRFIKVCMAAGAGVLVVTVLPRALEGIVNAGPSFTPAADLNREVLLPLEGDLVEVIRRTEAAVPLTVREVTTATPYTADGVRAAVGDTFSIIFEGSANRPLAQNSYEMSHGRLGRFPLFITPVDQSDGTTQRYEAVFNRLR
jgi:hypothetical protein